MPAPGSMHDAGFARVLGAEVMSNFGAMLSRLAIPWVATLLLAATPWQMAALMVAEVLAGAAGALALAAWVDAREKRRVMQQADALRALLLGALALAVWQGRVAFGALVALAAGAAAATAVFEMARSAWMARALAHERLPQYNARLAVATSLSETAAFAFGGWLFQWWGAALALAADAASYVASAICLRGAAPTAPVATRAVEGRHGAWSALRVGWDLVAGSALLRRLAWLEALRSLALAAAGTSWMIFVAREIGLGTGAIGVVAAVGGLGAWAGAMLAPGLGRRLGAPRAMAIGLALAALGAACTPLVPSAGWVGIGLLVAQQLFGDAGQVVHEVHERTLRQTRVAGPELARVDGALRAIGQGALLLGAALGAGLAEAAGTRVALAASALLLAVAAPLAARLPR